ncbi:hypothetical protein HPB47_015426 [Ixodes persulcatus]|uniref:Uncharacterized protein n=1 Tax=Ixodes persulcatus TaxID=34615 RepID=A0AC60QW44_IXOPE|nr:hypothetical protein HPB47_015426 [Ixodes persulcatus]
MLLLSIKFPLSFQLLHCLETLGHHREAVVRASQEQALTTREQARGMRKVDLELQNMARALVEVVMLLSAENSRDQRSADLPSPATTPLVQSSCPAQPSTVQSRRAQPKHPFHACNATDLSAVLTRDEKQWLWEQLALNAWEPPTKSSKHWKEHWSRRVMKARKRAAQLKEAARRTGGGSSAVRPLASFLARILTLVGADSGLGAPGVRVPGEWDDQQVREANQQQAPDGSRAGALHLTRQERHDAAAIQIVEQQTLLLQQNKDQGAEERQFRGQSEQWRGSKLLYSLCSAKVERDMQCLALFLILPLLLKETHASLLRDDASSFKYATGEISAFMGHSSCRSRGRKMSKPAQDTVAQDPWVVQRELLLLVFRAGVGAGIGRAAVFAKAGLDVSQLAVELLTEQQDMRDAAYVMSTRSSGSSNAREREPRRELSRLLVISDEMLREPLPQLAPPPLLELAAQRSSFLVINTLGAVSKPAVCPGLVSFSYMVHRIPLTLLRPLEQDLRRPSPGPSMCVLDR